MYRSLCKIWLVFRAVALAASLPIGALRAATLYVGDFMGNSVGAYDAVTGTPLTGYAAPAVSRPYDLALSASALYVSSPSSGVVRAFDAATGAPLGGFASPLGLRSPSGLLVSGNTLFISDPGTGRVGTYDAATGAPLNPALVSGLLNNFDLALAGTTLYVTVHDTIMAYDAATGALVRSFIFSGYGGRNFDTVVVAGDALYVTTRDDNAVGLYSATSGALISRFFIGGLSYAGEVAVVGNTLYVANGNQPTRVGVYDAATGTTRQSALVSSPDGFFYGVAVSGVPEPGTWAALLVGAGLLGAGTWRRRSI